MHDESDSFDPWEEPSEIGVDDHCDGDDGVENQCAVPDFGFVVWVVDLHKAEDDGRVDPGY